MAVLSTKKILVRTFIMLGMVMVVIYTWELWQAMDEPDQTKSISLNLNATTKKNINDNLKTTATTKKKINDNLKTTATTKKDTKIEHSTKTFPGKDAKKKSKSTTATESNLKKSNSVPVGDDFVEPIKSSSSNFKYLKTFQNPKTKKDALNKLWLVERDLKARALVPISIGPPLIPYEDGKSSNETEDEIIPNAEHISEDKINSATYGLTNCSCQRTLSATTDYGQLIMKGENGKRILSRRSICSNASSARGPNQRVISYCYYGDGNDPYIQQRYLDQIADRVQEMEKLYPDFIMRVYHNLLPNDPGWVTVCSLFCQYQTLDFCDVRELPEPWGNIESLHGRVWRFIAMMDPLVDVALSRDIDAWLQPREELAVREWLATGVPCHLMRDHPLHGHPLAGLWDANMGVDRACFYETVGLFMFQPIATHKPFNGVDQYLMQKYWWPMLRDKMLIHDSYTCEMAHLQGPYDPMPYPIQRVKHFFLGGGKTQVAAANLIKECPPKCRPAKHQDWIYC